MWIYLQNVHCRFKNVGPAPYSQQFSHISTVDREGGGLGDGVAAPGSPSPAGISHLRRFTPAWIPCGRCSWPGSRTGKREPYFWYWGRLWVINQAQRLSVSTGVFSSVSTDRYRGCICVRSAYGHTVCSICILLLVKLMYHFVTWKVFLNNHCMCLCFLETVSFSVGFKWKIEPEASSAALTYF